MRSLCPVDFYRDSEFLKRKTFTEVTKLKYGDSLSLLKRKRRVNFKEDDDGKHGGLSFDEIAPMIP